MAHEQLSAPRSQIDQDLRELEDFPDEERFLFLRETILHPMLTGELYKVDGVRRIGPLTENGNLKSIPYDAEQLPVAPSLPAEFVMPEVPISELIGDPRPFESLRDLPAPIHVQFETNEHFIMNVAQCYMMRVPKELNPILYLTMSECTAITGHSDTDVFVAHVGYGLTSQADAVMDYLHSSGVKDEDIRIVANTMGDESNFNPDEITWPAPEQRLLTKKAFAKYGIPEVNFIGFSDASVEGPAEIRNEIPTKVLERFGGKLRPIIEVAVTNNELFVGKSAQKISADPLSSGLLDFSYRKV